MVVKIIIMQPTLPNHIYNWNHDTQLQIVKIAILGKLRLGMVRYCRIEIP